MVTELTGLNLDTYFSASKFEWLVRENADVRSKLQNGEARGRHDRYILIHRLTGGRVFATDHTNASRTLLYDIGRLRWDDWLCEPLRRAPRCACRKCARAARISAKPTFEGILPRTVPICGVMGDSQASLFAQRCYEPGMAKITFGTGSSVLLNIGDEASVIEERLGFHHRLGAAMAARPIASKASSISRRRRSPG